MFLELRVAHAGDVVLLEIVFAELVGDHLRISLLVVPERAFNRPLSPPQRMYALPDIFDVLCYLVLLLDRQLLPHLHSLLRLGLLGLSHGLRAQEFGIDLAIVLKHSLVLLQFLLLLVLVPFPRPGCSRGERPHDCKLLLWSELSEGWSRPPGPEGQAEGVCSRCHVKVVHQTAVTKGCARWDSRS